MQLVHIWCDTNNKRLVTVPGSWEMVINCALVQGRIGRVAKLVDVLHRNIVFQMCPLHALLRLSTILPETNALQQKRGSCAS